MTNWSMSRRLVVGLTGTIGALWIAGVTFAATSMRHEIDEVFDSALQETAQRLLPLVGDEIGEEQTDENRAGQLPGSVIDDGHEEYLHYQVRDKQGRLLLRSHDAPDSPFPAPLVRGFYSDGTKRYYTELSADGALAVQVAELPKERLEVVQAFWIGLLVPLVGMLPLAAFAVRETVRRTMRPLHDVQREILARNGTNLAAIDAKGLPDELAPMVGDINRMLERLSTALDAEHAFAANSAHELRNPIAAAHAQAEIMAATATAEPDRQRAGHLVSTLATLSRKIEKMLQLARAEAGLGLSREETDLVAIVQLLFDEYMRKPQAHGRLRLEISSKAPLRVAVDPDALGIAIQNLIDNALKHGDPRAPVEISLFEGPVLAIRNDGPIVDADQLQRLTKRFERGSQLGREGTGLGLFIADMIMRQSGGTLELHSPARGHASGFEAVLRFKTRAAMPA